MVQNWLYLVNKRLGHSSWLQFLKEEGYGIIRRDSLSGDLDTVMRSGVVSGILFEGNESLLSKEKIANLVQKYPFCPLVLGLESKNAQSCSLALFSERDSSSSDLHVCLMAHESKERKSQVLKNLLQLSQLKRRVDELEQGRLLVRQKQVFSPLDFDDLEITSMIDRLLKHFGPLVPAQNLHWIAAVEMKRWLSLDLAAFRLEIQHRFMMDPLFRSYKEKDVIVVHEILKAQPSLLDMGKWSGNYFGVPHLSWRWNGQNHSLMEIRRKNRVSEEILGYFLFEDAQLEEIDFCLNQIRQSLEEVLPFIAMGLKFWQVSMQSFIDTLTPLYNNKFLPLAIDSEISRCQRKGGEFTVLFLDIDYFKLINDTHGHWVGSQVIQQLGQLISTHIRSCDFGFRYGGDEFVVLLVDTGLKSGKLVAERLRKQISDKTFIVDEKQIKLTISIGVASFPQHGSSKEEIIHLADQAMYAGKNSSRNIVYLAS